MVAVRPFRALAVNPSVADAMVSLPYDVMNSQEAAQMVQGGRNQFLHVSRPEIDMPEGADSHSAQAYAQSKTALDALVTDGSFIRSDVPVMYAMRQTMGDLVQVGLVASASVDDYDRTDIRIHEFTRPDKELDRVNHIDSVGAHDEPVFLTYRADDVIASIVAEAMAGPSVIDVTADDGIRHELWLIADASILAELVEAFEFIPRTYVAYGHHRSAAASVVRKRRKGDLPPKDPATKGLEFADGLDGFLAVLVPTNSVNVMPYNRVVHDLAGKSFDEFLAELEKVVIIESVDAALAPIEQHVFGMYAGGQWYRCRFTQAAPDASNPLEMLDVSLLQNQVLGPILAIDDPRTSTRISFVGGIRGTDELERLVDAGAAVAFSMPPTSVLDLMEVADIGEVMPPKSTWFEPKLPSGLVIHPFA